MALPDYSQYQNYKPYRQAYTGPKNEMLSRKQFRKGRDAYTPAAPEPPPSQSIFQPSIAPTPSANRDLSAHPFFDPNANYRTSTAMQNFEPGSLPYNIYSTEQSPEGYYYNIMNQQGFGGLDAKSQAAQGMYRDYARGYQAAKLQNNDLWFPEYMGMQDVGANVRNLSNRQLGIDENLYAGRDRWSLRGY
jgi:hypothetical protein